MMEPINTDSILSMVLCGVRSAARACPVMRHELVIHTHNVKLQESMSLISINVLYKSLLFLYHLHLTSLRVQRLPMSSLAKDSPALYNSQYSDYSDSNTS